MYVTIALEVRSGFETTNKYLIYCVILTYNSLYFRNRFKFMSDQLYIGVIFEKLIMKRSFHLYNT